MTRLEAAAFVGEYDEACLILDAEVDSPSSGPRLAAARARFNVLRERLISRLADEEPTQPMAGNERVKSCHVCGCPSNVCMWATANTCEHSGGTTPCRAPLPRPLEDK